MESGTRPRSQAVSNIPDGAISAAFLPVQRATNEQIRARQVQTQKNNHHTEDVEELDDTAVNSVHDQNQKQGREGKGGGKKKREEGEHVEIEALKSQPQAGHVEGGEKAGESHLDISA